VSFCLIEGCAKAVRNQLPLDPLHIGLNNLEDILFASSSRNCRPVSVESALASRHASSPSLPRLPEYTSFGSHGWRVYKNLRWRV